MREFRVSFYIVAVMAYVSVVVLYDLVNRLIEILNI